jgi:hypothetical protein
VARLPFSPGSLLPREGGHRRQTPAAGPQPLAERGCGPAADRDDARVARGLDPTPVVDGVYRLDEGAWRDDVFSCWQEVGRGDGLSTSPGPALPRERGPLSQDGPARWSADAVGARELAGAAGRELPCGGPPAPGGLHGPALTTDDQEGTAEPGRPLPRWDVPPPARP